MSQLRSQFVLAPQLVFYEEKKGYLQTQRCDSSLADFIADCKTRVLPLSDLIPLIRKLALGLQAVHAAGVAHGDIKPSNCLLHPALE
jgi:serine/threonine protein kinase